MHEDVTKKTEAAGREAYAAYRARMERERSIINRAQALEDQARNDGAHTVPAPPLPEWEALGKAERMAFQAAAIAATSRWADAGGHYQDMAFQVALDAKLGRDLAAKLSPYAGETGDSEGAVEVLERLLRDVEDVRRARERYKLSRGTPVELLLSEVKNRAHVQAWDAAVACAGGVDERMGYVHPSNVLEQVGTLRRIGERGRLEAREVLLEGALTLADRALRLARQTVEVPSLFPPGHPRAGESLEWHAMALAAEKAAGLVLPALEQERPMAQRVRALLEAHLPDLDPKLGHLVADMAGALLSGGRTRYPTPSAGLLVQRAAQRVAGQDGVLLVELSQEEDGRHACKVPSVEHLAGYGNSFGEAVESALEAATCMNPVETPDPLRAFVTSRAMGLLHRVTREEPEPIRYIPPSNGPAPAVVAEATRQACLDKARESFLLFSAGVARLPEGVEDAILEAEPNVGALEGADVLLHGRVRVLIHKLEQTRTWAGGVSQDVLAVVDQLVGDLRLALRVKEGPEERRHFLERTGSGIHHVLRLASQRALAEGDKHPLRAFNMATTTLGVVVDERGSPAERWRSLAAVAMALGLVVMKSSDQRAYELARAAVVALSALVGMAGNLMEEDAATVRMVLALAGREAPEDVVADWSEQERQAALAWAMATAETPEEVQPPPHVEMLARKVAARA